LRVLNISGWDVEACGGTHTSMTGDIGFIKILKSERIQDGIERIEFVGGEPALKHIQMRENILKEISETVESPQNKVVTVVTDLKRTNDILRKKQKQLIKELVYYEVPVMLKKAIEIKGLKVCVSKKEGLGEEYHVPVGDQAISTQPHLIYCGISLLEKSVRIFIFSGDEAQKNGVRANVIARNIAITLGGSGGGDSRFGQGGGNRITRINKLEDSLKNIISLHIKRE